MALRGRIHLSACVLRGLQDGRHWYCLSLGVNR